MASTTVNLTTAPIRYLQPILKSLFGFGARPRPQRETLADRIARISRVRISPFKLVGYAGEGATFTASPSDFRDRTIQGVKFDWETSDPQKLQIDEAGRATFLQPGRAWITCRAGTASATAPVLIRPGHRPVQSDQDWRNDQNGLDASGNVVGQSEGSSESTVAAAGKIINTLLDKVIPTASAQSPPDFWRSDLGYDQLWNEPRNALGSPRNAAAEPMPLGSVLPEGSNFNWSVPIVGLGGRGIGTNLALYYNSRVWSRRNNAMAFDAITCWPAPGFSLGFGRIVVYEIGSGGNPPCKFMLVDPDGTRHYLGAGTYNGIGYALGGPYETLDGTHIVYTGNGRDGGDLHYPDGTKVNFTAVNNRLLPTTIYGNNGNYVQIAYKPDCFQVGEETYCGYYAPMAIDYVTDTLGRKIEFQYDSNYRLSAINAPGFGGSSENPVTQTLVQFDYQTVSPSYSFTGLTVERAAGNLRLKHVYFPATGTGYKPAYSQYGMIHSVSARRQMSINGSGVISDGVETANVTFNYPISGVLTDAPAFTQRTETAVNSPSGVFSYSTSINTLLQTMAFTITRPDSTTLALTRSTNASSPAKGRLTQSEIKIGSTSLGKSVLAYVNDAGSSPQGQAVTTYDDTGTPMKVDFDYDQYGNVTNKREYGNQVSGTWQVRRRTHFTYSTSSSYLNAYLRGLVTLVETFDALQNTNDADDVPLAKTSYALDNYVAMGGMENYGGEASPMGHLSWYDASFTARGNVTGVTEWTDLGAGTTVQRLAKLDIFGNVVKAQVSCCQEKDLTITDATFWSLPDSETSGDPNGIHTTTSTDYDFNTSLAESHTNAAGLETNIGYNAMLQPSSVTLPTGASAGANFNYANSSSTTTQTYDDLGTEKTITTTTNYDGWGRVVSTVAPNNAQENTSYDAMGRVISQTNPFQSGGAPGPATTTQYDVANRAVITTLPDGNIVRSDYSGSTVTVTDQVNRKIKRESDGLGRLVKVTEQDPTGALAQDTNYSYSLLDQLTLVNQGNQIRSYKYDAIGRLLYEKIPEQSATINDGTGTMWSCAYAYTEYSAIKKKTDARGVESHYMFDALHRVTSIWYTGLGGDDSGAVRPGLPSGVAATGDVGFAYTDWGALSGVSISSPGGIGYPYTETYAFDSFTRPMSVTRTIPDHTWTNWKTYTTSYEYNLGGQPSKITYPSGQQVAVNHDNIGRTQSLTYNPGDTSGYLTGMGYNIAGQVTGLTLGNGVVESYGYDANRFQLTTQTAVKGATSLMNLTHNYQAAAGQMGAGSTAGNTGQLMGVSGTINSTLESAANTYDNIGRLVTSNQTSNGSSAQRRFVYDRWGNRTGVWDAVSGGNQIQSITLEQSGGTPTNRITSVTSGSTLNYSYDAAGNVTNDGVHSYSYDAEKRLARVDGGATAQYKYDHQNRRMTKIVGSAWTHYIWEGTQVIGEHDATTAYSTNPTYQVKSARVDYIYAGGRMIHSRQRASSTAPWTTRYFLSDRLSVRMTLDSSGNVLGRQAHLSFGEDFGESGIQEKHHFTSYERDPESGAADYAVNRYYSSLVGRFPDPDPYAGSVDQENPQTWNRYAYVSNDPVNSTDPEGLDGCTIDFHASAHRRERIWGAGFYPNPSRGLRIGPGSSLVDVWNVFEILIQWPTILPSPLRWYYTVDQELTERVRWKRLDAPIFERHNFGPFRFDVTPAESGRHYWSPEANILFLYMASGYERREVRNKNNPNKRKKWIAWDGFVTFVFFVQGINSDGSTVLCDRWISFTVSFTRGEEIWSVLQSN
ncbi:MAG: RHS repeat-associated core domain-containing protein [Blastocatellia bacterium]